MEDINSHEKTCKDAVFILKELFVILGFGMVRFSNFFVFHIFSCFSQITFENDIGIHWNSSANLRGITQIFTNRHIQ